MPPEMLFMGNGAADVIDRLVLAVKPCNALLAAPTFGEYERALHLVGCRVRHHKLKAENDFMLDESFLAGIDKETDIVFLCQPNNPTGQTVKPALLNAVLTHCEQNEVLFVLDECFVPFLKEAKQYSLLNKIKGSRYLFILGSFTKLYAMAGLRLGFGVCGNKKLLAQLSQAGQPWAVSAVAQAAGQAALLEDAYVARSLQEIQQEKSRLKKGLAKQGCKVIGSAANSIFFYNPKQNFAQLLAEKGILIRDCSGFKGLTQGYYRIAVRTAKENSRLLAALAEI